MASPRVDFWWNSVLENSIWTYIGFNATNECEIYFWHINIKFILYKLWFNIKSKFLTSLSRFKETSSKLSAIFNNDFENIASENDAVFEYSEVSFSEDSTGATVAEVSAYAVTKTDFWNPARVGRLLGFRYKSRFFPYKSENKFLMWNFEDSWFNEIIIL